jgi:drug/metabolite transporter (DMT)-like permease
LLHQTVLVAFLSYLGWFWLMERYRVSDLSSFSFFTPLFGVVFGGLLLGEALPAMLWLGLAFVAGGIYLANRAPRPEGGGRRRALSLAGVTRALRRNQGAG